MVQKKGCASSAVEQSRASNTKSNHLMRDENKETPAWVRRDQNCFAQPRSQQQPQQRLVRWDSFQPFRSLKVLLVENDDSTCHVVGALLRNCGYEVKEVPDGKQAWKVLEDITIDVDLVLTEVVLPSLSGIGLLGKITNNRTFKDIPVIMMSSIDSSSMVFKCLSKGAVDFLVKPIRKNELKNLWQHVWRKYHGSSGSGSDSGLRIENPMESRTVEDYDNNNGSNDEDDDTESITLNFGDESDNGTQEVGQLAAKLLQSSWTRAVDLDTHQAMSPQQASFADPPDSTCAQAIHPRKEAFGNNWLPEGTTSTPVGQDDELDKRNMGKDLKIGMCGIMSLQLEDPCENELTNKADKSSELNVNKNDEQLEIVELDLGNEELNAEKTQALDLMGVSTTGVDSLTESVVLGIPNGLSSGALTMDEAIYNNKEIPFFEVILTRPRDVQDTRTRANDQSVLRHSDLSACLRYNYAATANLAHPTGNVDSCYPLDNGSDAAKTESEPYILLDANGSSWNRCSNGSSNNNDMGSMINDVSTKQVTFADKPTPKSSVKLQTSSSFQQAAGSSQCGSSNSFRASTEGNAGNRNLHRSALGSYRRRNGHRRNAASNSRGKKMSSDDRVTGKGGTNEGSGFGNRSGKDQNHYVQREAALKRFRQKRQERCFEKKVRYQSRKILAEQRPRIRGQFIRKGLQENKGKGVLSYEPDSFPQ